MNHIKDFKTFEAESFGVLLTTSKEDLTSYWHCKDSNHLWKTFNDESTNCRFCGSHNIEKLSDFDYMSQVKNRLEPEEFEEELKQKREREQSMVDLVDAAYMKQKQQYRKNIN